MVRQTGKTAGVAVAALIGLSLGGAALAAPGDPWDDRGSYRGDIYHRHDRPDAARHPARMQPDPLWQHRQNVHRQELAVRHHPGPVYADRPGMATTEIAPSRIAPAPPSSIAISITT